MGHRRGKRCFTEADDLLSAKRLSRYGRANGRTTGRTEQSRAERNSLPTWRTGRRPWWLQSLWRARGSECRRFEKTAVTTEHEGFNMRTSFSKDLKLSGLHTSLHGRLCCRWWVDPKRMSELMYRPDRRILIHYQTQKFVWQK